LTSGEFISTIDRLSKELIEINKTPCKKRKEEKDKYVLKRFFQYLQLENQNRNMNFWVDLKPELLSEFSDEEIAHFFKSTKEKSLYFPKLDESKSTYHVPAKLNDKIFNRLFRIPFFRNQLIYYLDHFFLDKIRKEIFKKINSYGMRFNHVYSAFKNMEGMYESTVINYALKKNRNGLWSVSEGKSVIGEIKDRLKFIE